MDVALELVGKPERKIRNNSPVEVGMVCEPDLAEELVVELNDKLPPSPRLGVGKIETSDTVVDIVNEEDSMGFLVAFGDGSSPGMSSRKHFGCRGVGCLYNDQGLVLSSRYFPSAPRVAPNSKPTSKFASLTTSTPVFEAPVSLPQVPFPSAPTMLGFVFVQ